MEIITEKEANTWSPYPHSDFRHCLKNTFSLGARLDAWRRFLSPEFLNPLHDFGAELQLNTYYQNEVAYVSFPEDLNEEKARAIIDALLRLDLAHEPYKFLRDSLSNPKAWATFPLSDFVDCDSRVSPRVHFSIRKHWQVLLSQFSFGHHQKNHVKLHSLDFKHPQLLDHLRDGQQVVAKAFEKGVTPAARREQLLLDAESHAEEWKFSILEREVIRRLNGEPSTLVLNDR